MFFFLPLLHFVYVFQVYFAYVYILFIAFFFFFKQKTAYEMRISDWSSDVCSSDLSRKHGRHRFPGLRAPLDFARDQMTDHFGIGLAGENPALRDQFIAQRLEILDDTIVDQRHVADDMGMRVVLGWFAMSGPAGMGHRSEERRGGQECVGRVNSGWSGII